MSHYNTLWQRMGTMFRGSSRIENVNGGNGKEAHPSDPATHPEVEGPSLLSLRRTRRRPSSADLHERYERVGQLLDSMREHFDVQDERSKELGESIARMADVFEQLPEAQRTQSDCMQAIATHLSNANRQSAELKDTLVRVPSSIQAQADAIQAVSRQMAVSSKTDTQMAGALQRLSRVVNGLGLASRSQIEALQRMETETAGQRTTLAEVVHGQNRSLLIALIVSGAISVAAITALLIVLTV